MVLKDDFEYLKQLLHDMKIFSRDIDNFKVKQKYNEIIAQFEKGIQEELDNSNKN